MNAFLALVRKDLILYFSNKRALIITLAAPIAIAAFFGSVFGGGDKKPTRVPIAIVDQDGSPIAKQVILGLTNDSALNVTLLDEAVALDQVKNGKVRAAVVLPPKFGDSASRAMFSNRAKPEVKIHFDPSQSIALAMIRGLLAQHAMKAVTQSMMGSGGGTMIANARADVLAATNISTTSREDLIKLFDSVERVQKNSASDSASNRSAGPSFDLPFTTVAEEATGNQERKYNGYAHSFGGMTVQFLLFMGIDLGVGLLLMRRMGLWKRLRAAPVSRTLLLGSTIASGTLIALILMCGIFAVAILAFGVRIDGSVVGFIGNMIAFALLASSFGLLIASIGKTPEATRGLAVFATLVMVMLGGAWVPSFIFPEWLQTISVANPARWAVDGFDAMTWRGQGLDAAIIPIGAMLA
ncbi:MAG: ABC transporter permease, partial [Usitatibacteraceae bacterium]